VITESIPKILHYIWLGGNKKPDNFDICFASWQKHFPKEGGWEIKEWNENNLPVSELPKYYHKAIKEKKWAFASDVARTYVLLKYGGVYLDTDMLVYKSMDELLKYEFFSGYEDEKNIACGINGSIIGSIIVAELYSYYEKNTEIKAIPIIMTEVINELREEDKLPENIYIAKQNVFYSYPKDRPCDPLDFVPPKEALAIHLWDYSWQSDTKKNLKKIPGFNFIKNTLNKLGVLNMVKKLLKQV
jgi:mannosyltransferase OCH1-like enzyme